MNEGNNQRNPRRRENAADAPKWDVQEVAVPSGKAPQRRPQQRSASAPQRSASGAAAPNRRPASSQNGRPASPQNQKGRPVSSQNGRPASPQRRTAPSGAQRTGAQRTGAPARRPVQQRTAGPAQPQRKPAQKKPKRNYTRLYVLIGALAACALLFFGIKALKKQQDNQKAGSASAEQTQETTTTTEPVVTEPPIVQNITFNTPLTYSSSAGAEVTDFNGDAKMKVLIPQGAEPTEVVWNLPQLVGSGNASKVRTVCMDITCASSVPIGQCSGGLRALVPEYNAETGVQEGTSPVKITDILLIDRENTENTWHVEISLPQSLFSGETSELSFVRYGDNTTAELYLDNIQFLDTYGSPLDIVYNAPGAETGAHTAAPTDATTTTASALPQ